MKKTIFFITLIIIIIISGICGAEDYNGLSQRMLNGRPIGIQTGTSYAQIVESNLPDSRIFYYNSVPDLAAALTGNKIDGFPIDEPVIRYIMGENKKVAYIPEKLDPFDFAFVFKKDENGKKLRDQMSEFMKQLKADGTLDDLEEIWFGTDESTKVLPNYASFSAENGVLKLATEAANPPFDYISGKNITGYEIDITARFCEKYGYGLEIKDMGFDAILPSVQSGKFDFGCATITITEERAENIYFSDPDYLGGVVFAIRSEESEKITENNSSILSTEDNSPNLSMEDMNGKLIGTLTGSIGGTAIEENFPDSQVLYFDTITDMLTALQAGKIDGMCYDDSVFKFMQLEVKNLEILDGYLVSSEYAPIFPKNEKGQALANQYSEFVKKLWADGTIEEIDDIWFSDDEESADVLDYENLPDINGTLHMAADLSQVPFVMMVNDRIVGYDVDIAARFCEANGYRLEIEPMNFASIIPAVVSGKCDFASSNFTVTPERAESVIFSEPVYRGGLTIAVLDADGEPDDDEDNTSEQKPGAEHAENKTAIPEYKDFSELSGKTVSMLTGVPFEDVIRSKVPNIGGFSYYNTITDIILALKSGKTDACLNNNAVAQLAVNRDPEIALFPKNLQDSSFGIAFAEGDPNRDKWQAAFDGIDKDTIQAAWEKWTGSDYSIKVLPKQDWPGRNGTVKAAVCDTVEPMSYAGEKGKLMGFDEEMILLMAKELDVHVDFIGMELSAVLAAVQSGKALLGAGSIIITPEREEAVDFIPYYPSALVLVVRSVQNQEADQKKDLSLKDLNGKPLGVQTGSSFGPMMEENFPDSIISYYNSNSDLVTALTNNKIVSFPVDEPVIRCIMGENDKISYIPDYVDPFEFGCIFRKNDAGEKLRDEFNEFIEQITTDGTFDELQNIWFGSDESKKILPNIEELPGPNGKLTMATEALYPPFQYVNENQIVGYEIDLAIRFCEKYGYKLEIKNMSLDSILPSIQSGKYDFGCSAFTITEERAESVYFSVPDYSGGVVMAILNPEKAAGSDSDISDNFDQVPAGKYSSFDELDGKQIGVQTGTNFDDMVLAEMPNANVLYFNNKADMVGALQTGKIDAYVIDEPVIRFEMRQNSDLTYIPEYLDTYDFGYVFVKNEKGQTLQKEVNEFLEQIKSDGTLEKIEDQWINGDESGWKVDDYKSFPAPKGIIHVVTEPLYEPFGFIYNGEIVGYEDDIIVRFCKEYGYGLEFINTSYDSILPSIQAGKYEIGAAGLTVTDERANSVLFSEPYYHGGTVLVVQKANEKAAVGAHSPQSTFMSGIKESFSKTFIRENRWMLFLQGIMTTLLITLLSILFGTILGFLLFMMCRNGNPAANAVTAVCLWLVQGMPMVVLLMILYYVIFGSSSISGAAVAVIGFTLTFGASVFGLLRMGVGAIDKGQYEAAYALGFSNPKTFFKIILPQAIPHVMPAYKGEIIGLLKATAVVGYVAVQDLTKMGDIVRSRTYEAFFPLIAVTIIYFLLEAILGLIIRWIAVRIDPKKRNLNNILKGVKDND